MPSVHAASNRAANSQTRNAEERLSVVLQYAQDVSPESYLQRAPTGRPKGLAPDREYVIINYLNTPGSIEETIVSNNPEEALEATEGVPVYSENTQALIDALKSASGKQEDGFVSSAFIFNNKYSYKGTVKLKDKETALRIEHWYYSGEHRINPLESNSYAHTNKENTSILEFDGPIANGDVKPLLKIYVSTDDLDDLEAYLSSSSSFEIELYEGNEKLEEGSFLFISGTSPPTMPDVRIKVSGNAEEYEAKLVVEDIIYKKYDGAWMQVRDDESSFPTSGGWQDVENEATWDVNFGTRFCGGKVYAIAKSGGVEDTLIFHIRGQNPDIGLIQAYQLTIPNGDAWYFPRMLRQESTFRQFNNGTPGPNNGAPVDEGDRSIDNGGRPNWGYPYGWGLKQLDNLDQTYGTLSTFNGRYGPSINEIWNWQANQRKGVEFFNGDKLQAAQSEWNLAIQRIATWERINDELVQDNYPMQIEESLNATEIGTVIDDGMEIGTVIYSSHHRNIPNGNVSLLIADALKRYNGGSYYDILIPDPSSNNEGEPTEELPIWIIDKTGFRGNDQNGNPIYGDYVQEISTINGW